MKLCFLGTGGGRFVTLSQLRWTGGFRVEGKQAIHIDPGPGALRAYHHFSFSRKLDAIFLSHSHLDHVNDVNAIIELMTRGATRKGGVVFGDREALGYVTPYHAELVELRSFKPGDKAEIAGFNLEFTATEHSKKGLGVIIREKHSIWYSGDTEVLEEHFKIKVDVAVLNVLRPWGDRFPGHMTSDQAAEWGLNTKPKLIIIQHFGRKMLNAGPEKEAKRIEEYSGVRTIAARDGQTFDIDSLLSSSLQALCQLLHLLVVLYVLILPVNLKLPIYGTPPPHSALEGVGVGRK